MATETTAPQASRTFLRETTSVSATVTAAARQLWRAQMQPGGRWRPTFSAKVAPQLVALMIAAQTRAAAAGSAYVGAALAETGQASAPAGALIAESLAGVSSIGTPLDSLLYGAVVSAGQAFNAGTPAAEALEVGAQALTTLVMSQVSDAARVGTAVQMAADTEVDGYVRMIVGPTCKRCLILAGRVYDFREAFKRHPRCDCRHIPVSENVAGDLTTDPQAYFDSLSKAEQDRVFGEDAAEAIRLGADINQVVNAERGMTTTVIGGRSLATTTASTTRRGVFRGSGPRLMPEAIIQISESRDEAIRLLRRFGYIR